MTSILLFVLYEEFFPQIMIFFFKHLKTFSLQNVYESRDNPNKHLFLHLKDG